MPDRRDMKQIKFPPSDRTFSDIPPALKESAEYAADYWSKKLKGAGDAATEALSGAAGAVRGTVGEAYNSARGAMTGQVADWRQSLAAEAGQRRMEREEVARNQAISLEEAEQAAARISRRQQAERTLIEQEVGGQLNAQSQYERMQALERGKVRRPWDDL